MKYFTDYRAWLWFAGTTAVLGGTLDLIQQDKGERNQTVLVCLICLGVGAILRKLEDQK